MYQLQLCAAAGDATLAGISIIRCSGLVGSKHVAGWGKQVFVTQEGQARLVAAGLLPPQCCCTALALRWVGFDFGCQQCAVQEAVVEIFVPIRMPCGW